MVELRVRLGSKGQVVIPKILRETYGMYPMQEVIISEKDEGVIIKKPESDILEYFKKIAKIATEKRKGKPFKYDKNEFYEQYEKRLKRAGL